MSESLIADVRQSLVPLRDHEAIDALNAIEERTRHANLTECIFGLALNGFTIPEVAGYLDVPEAVVRAERARCRDLALKLIGDVLIEEWKTE